VISDDLEMKALAEWGGIAERTAAAFAAGCDALLVCHRLEDLPEVIARLEDPDLDSRREEALARVAVYRERLATLGAAREQADHAGEAGHGDRLEEIRAALGQVRASAEAMEA
jgi:beta-glucosidase-like glycosyl hydrolase